MNSVSLQMLRPTMKNANSQLNSLSLSLNINNQATKFNNDAQTSYNKF